MRKSVAWCMVWAGSVLLVCLSVLSVSAWALAQTAPVQGTAYNVAASMKDNLQSFAGKDVYVTLRSGRTFQGYVKAVGDHFLHLEKIAGKDFYDALIRMEDISAIEVKFRGVK